MTENPDGEVSRGVSRRTVAKAMAWAVPVIAVATPVPAYAASGSDVELAGNGAACKLPGNSGSLYKGYALGFSANNPIKTPLLITIVGMTLNSESLGDLQIINLDNCDKLGTNTFTLPSNTFYPNLVVLTQFAGTSSAGTLTAAYVISGGPGGAVSKSAEIGAVPPIQGGSCDGFTQAEKDCIAQQNVAEDPNP
jgi:hypothetical protein